MILLSLMGFILIFGSERASAQPSTCAGDANDDSTTNVQDVISTINEILGIAPAPGNPDCNIDENVNVQDVICDINIILGISSIPVECPSFAEDIQPIFTNSCATVGCHSGPMPSFGLNLEEGQALENIFNVPSGERMGQDLVEPGDPDNSYLFQKISGNPEFGHAGPPTNPNLFIDSPELLQLIEDWIQRGAPDN